MQNATERADSKTNRLPVVVAVTIMIFLVTAAAVYYVFFIRVSRPSAGKSPELSAVPSDAVGNNLIGNTGENLSSGGFIAEQGGWIYFANFADAGALYMCREGGDKMVKLTDFPVANINVLADSLVFTGLEKCLAARNDGIYEVSFENIPDLLERIQFSSGARYGGRLYAIYGLHSGAQPRLRVMDASDTYFSPFLDRDGLYAFSSRLRPEDQVDSLPPSSELALAAMSVLDTGQSISAPDFYIPHTPGINLLSNKMAAVTIPAGAQGESVVRQFERNGILYVEMLSATSSRIVRFDLKSLQPVDEIGGRNLLESGESLMFLGTNDGFAYELNPVDASLNPISTTPLSELSHGRDGSFVAKTLDGEYIIISKENRYQSLFDKLRLAAGRVILKKSLALKINGWYNYLDTGLTSSSADFELTEVPGFFRAGNHVYHLGADGVWTENGELVEWLNRTPALEPFSSIGDYDNEAVFRPAWTPQDASAPDIAQDFGAEITPPQPQQPDAPLDARDALAATIMLLRAEDAVSFGYSPESVKKISEYSGSDVESVVQSRVDTLLEFYDGVATSPGGDDVRAMVENWFFIPEYRIGGASVNEAGNVAQVTLTVSHTVDGELISDAILDETGKRLGENPETTSLSRTEQLEWFAGIALDVMENPREYGGTDPDDSETIILMKKDPQSGWVADDIHDLAECFVRGIDF